uniref:Cytochrome b5 heme-binding domain-containing protein n=1 Tax=Ditylenchus dipsaci TaxID=166011 RepID=A0A915CXK7_9BILA
MCTFCAPYLCDLQTFPQKAEPVDLPPPVPQIPPLKKQDMTVEQLKKYNGVEDEHICFALLGKIYDVTKGRDFYGVDGAYGALAGHDATRALGTMNIKLVKDEWDDTSDLSPTDLEDAKDWAERMEMKYPVVGRLLAPGEEASVYEEQETTQ